jgi:hypothetical protein
VKSPSDTLELLTLERESQMVRVERRRPRDILHLIPHPMPAFDAGALGFACLCGR